MCFNKEVSIIVFVFGLAAAVMLIARGLKYRQTAPKWIPNYTNSKLTNFYKKRDIVLGIMFFMIALMQLSEYFMWQEMNPVDDELKPVVEAKKRSNFEKGYSWIAGVLVAQVVVTFISLGLLGFFNFDFKNYKFAPYISVVSIITFCIFIGLSIEAFKMMGWGDYDKTQNPDDYLSYKDGNTCRLVWGPLVGVYNNNPDLMKAWLAFYIITFFLLTLLVPTNIVLPFLIGLTFVISLIYASQTAESSKDGSEVKSGKPDEDSWVTMFGSFWCFIVIVIVIIGVMWNWIDYTPFTFGRKQWLCELNSLPKTFKC